MARIAFFTESLPPNGDVIGRFAWDLIQALAEQEHEIRVFSTYREGEELPESHPRIEIVRPFRKWSLLELPKAVPLLLAFKPDVLHLIQPHQEALSGFSNAMEIVPALRSVIGNPAMIASFFDLDSKSLRRHRLLLKSIRALTVSNQTQNDLITAHFDAIGSPPEIAVVPMGFGITPLRQSTENEIIVFDSVDLDSIHALKAKFPKLIVVAGPVESHSDPECTFRAIASALKFDPQAAAVILDGWGRLPVRARHACEEIIYGSGVANRVLLTGPLDESTQIECISAASCVLVAPLIETRLAFTKFLRSAQRAGNPLVLSVEQARMDPINWRDGENALIRARSPHDLADALLLILQNPDLQEKLRKETVEVSRRDVSDQPGNLVSRLYVKILNG